MWSESGILKLSRDGCLGLSQRIWLTGIVNFYCREAVLGRADLTPPFLYLLFRVIIPNTINPIKANSDHTAKDKPNKR